MNSFLNTRQHMVVVLVASAALLAVPTGARTQDKANAGGNGIPQQVAVLQAQLAQANAAISELQKSLASLQAAVGAEATARQGADSVLQAGIDAQGTACQEQESRVFDAIRATLLPQYFIVPGPLPEDRPPIDIGEVVP